MYNINGDRHYGQSLEKNRSRGNLPDQSISEETQIAQ